LQRRICKPLDKPLIPKTPDDVVAFDHEVDDSEDASEASPQE